MDAPVRIDKWLWAARLMKTRPAAVEAVNGGRVELNGARTKPSKEIRPGDELVITRGEGVRQTVVVRGTSERRGPASVAQHLYEETPDSVAARERHAEQRRLTAPPPQFMGGGRPTKRDRRRLDERRGRR
jgi:ribosome-associated heat shock protein Hsp15